MLSQYTKTFNVILFTILTVVIMVIHNAANAASYEDKAKALSISFEQFCSNVDFTRVSVKSRMNVRAYVKARSIERAAGMKIRACGSDKACVKQVKFNSIKELRNARELKVVGYFGWSPATIETVRAEAKALGFRE